MTDTFQLPALKGCENGSLEIEGETYGWVKRYPGKQEGKLTSVFKHLATGDELIIVVSRLEHGEQYYVLLAQAGGNIEYGDSSHYIADQVNDSDDESSEIADVWTYSVNQTLQRIQESIEADA